VSILETVLIFGVIPAAIYAVIAVLSVLGKKYAGTAPVHYDLRSQWTHEPVLWSAVDEVTTHAHHSGHAAIAAAPADLIGGTASGKW
jgi:hypothetical protein